MATSDEITGGAGREGIAIDETAPVSGDRSSDLAQTAPVVVQSGPIKIGSRIDRFVILEQLGRGGSGVVYAAHDIDLDRKVAIKFVHPGSGGGHPSAYAGRLLREAQALARLSHPNVVAVYEIGKHNGDVFLAEELVQGTTLRGWLDKRPRTWREILDMFLQAGRGLVAAHAAGVIHRDFKPDNVLVSKDGRVQVTDFGLARAGREAEEAIALAEAPGAAPVTSILDTPLTQTGTMLGTPAYMAPEQLRGEPTDERTDIFCFCVALHEALCGERPFAGDVLADLRRSVEAGQVRPPPRGRKMPAHIQRALSRGLSVRQADRQPSMTALLEELGNDPWVRRRRLLLGVGVLSLTAVALAGGYALHRDRAERCTGARARLAGVWDAAAQDRVRSAILATGRAYADDTWRRAREALDGYADAWAASYRDACEATTVRGEQSAESLDLRTGCLETRRADLQAAVQVLESTTAADLDSVLRVTGQLPSLAECRDVTALRARSPMPSDPATRDDVDRLYREVARASALRTAGHYQDALVLIQRAADQTSHIAFPPLRAEALTCLGMVQQNLGDYAHARETLYAAWDEAVAAGDDERKVRVLGALGVLLGHDLSLHQEALEVLRLARGVLSGWGRGRGGEAMVLYNTGVVLRDSGDAAGALARFQRARELAALDVPPVVDRAKIDNAIATIHFEKGELDLARAGFEEVLREQSDTLGDGHPEVATTLNNLGSVAATKGDIEAARSYFERTLAIREGALGGDHPALLIPLYNLALICNMTDHPDEARAHLERAVAISEKAYGADSEQTAIYQAALAESLLDAPDGAAEALQMVERALAIQQRAKSAESPDTAWLLVVAGTAYRLNRRPEKGLPLTERARAICQRKSCAVDVAARIAFELACELRAAGRAPGRAASLAREARAIFVKLGEGSADEVARIDEWLAGRAP